MIHTASHVTDPSMPPLDLGRTVSHLCEFLQRWEMLNVQVVKKHLGSPSFALSDCFDHMALTFIHPNHLFDQCRLVGYVEKSAPSVLWFELSVITKKEQYLLRTTEIKDIRVAVANYRLHGRFKSAGD